MSKLFNAKKVVLGIATTATVIVTSFGSYTQVYAYAPGCSKEEIEVPKQEEIVTPPAAEPEAPKLEETVTPPPVAEPESPKQEETVIPPTATPEAPKQEEMVTPPAATPEASKQEEMVTPPTATPESPKQEETVTPPSESPEAPKQEETVTPPSESPEAPKQEETVTPPAATPEAPKQEETVTPPPAAAPEAPKQEETVTPPTATPEIPKQEVIEDTVFSVKTPLGEGTATVEGHYGTDAEIQKMYELINAYRIANGKEPLTYNIKMNTVNRGADERAVTTANYWEHWHYAYSENIAYTPVFYSGYDDMEMVEKVFEAWIASEGHRNNILNAGSTKHETAISVFYKKVEGGYERYWVQCFR